MCQSHRPSNNPCVNADTICVGLARVGCEDQLICAETLEKLAEREMGGPLHSLVVCGKLHPMEIEFIKLYSQSAHFDELAALHNKMFD